MKINVNIPGSERKKDLVNLRKYLVKSGIEGVDEIQIERDQLLPNEMGGGMVNSVTALVGTAQSSLVALIDVLKEYVKSFRTEIMLRNENGAELTLSTKKINEEGIQELVSKFVNSPVEPPEKIPATPKKRSRKKNPPKKSDAKRAK